ncbi:MAG: addiction module toxin RelE [Alphaproteobacteria bacterium 16-39-46]|nr:MAG: addiction module toxin RelE [Alphaproteobacteria bacterium 16-39-46]OZA42312.1 MAG: addiction module toxin RelE [Alphaproteobacteria bacterium 17-39-52]HQS84531.1 type II toxin-antitoxin system HigB family toxin [Alphaproteobacteria bacterium]HQS94324.1 type II toxin-antitoxin system HigB family toxin [Alphaproteobacteria bacterium]
MRIISTKCLQAFWRKHPQADQPLKSWFEEARHAKWKSPNDIRLLYRSDDFLKKNRVVFNIAGNKFRLVVQIRYDYGIIYMRFIGTHAEYNRIDAETR